MHRNTKRLASALLAAALCLLLVPQAGADYAPWTYEVDDMMSTYGVEYYADVGFENPSRSQEPAGQSTGDEIAVYGAEAEQPINAGLAVYADDASTAAVANAYSVTIPAEVKLTEETPSATLNITGSVQQYRVLTIDVSSKNDWKLNCADNAAYNIGYTLKGFDGEAENTASTEKKIVIDNGTGADEKKIDQNLTATLSTAADRKDTVSGDYTDTLTFTFACEKKSTTVTIKYETMNSIKLISSGNAIYNYPRKPVYNDGTTTEAAVNTNTIQKEVLMTAGADYTWKITDYLSNANEDDWENPEISYTATGNENTTGVNVTFQRKMYELDLNIALYDSTTGRYKSVSQKVSDETSYDPAAQNWGTTQPQINGVNRGNPIADYYTGHPKNASYAFTQITANSGYQVNGYALNVKYAEFTYGEGITKSSDRVLPITNNTVSGTFYSSTESGKVNTDGTYGAVIVWLFIEKTTDSTSMDETDTSGEDETTVLLPATTETTPVVVDVPAADAAEPDAAPTADTAAAPDTTQAADITPDELRIMDADEMLAGFALQDAQPVW